MSKDRAIIAGLILAALLELLLLLAHTGMLPIRGAGSNDGVEAGRIVKTHNHLRRRNLNSLVWEQSESNDAVYFHDSLLTLSESTATLELNGTTDISLSENTLITIDPPDDLRSGEIRLRFTRGNLQARNPFEKSAIVGDEWSVSIKPGTDLEVRDVGDKNIEVKLKTGDATVHSSDGEHELNADQILRVTPQGSSALKVDDRLKWLRPPPRRIYLHGENLPLQLEWEGEAQALVVQTLGRHESVIPLPSGASSYLADLPIGNHRIYLRSDTATSAALDVQVWRAPLIHLLSPLPRNRVELNQPVAFIWQFLPQVPSYELYLTGERFRSVDKVEDNTLTKTFTTEDTGQWYVEGHDRDGFKIPPLYRYPIFIREKPFAPPRLNSPKIRAPANEAAPPRKGAWLWSWILPQAHADEVIRYEAQFSWDPVPGADLYVVEISEGADFRNPIVNTTVQKGSSFTWRDFALKPYYWRVAAGHSRGRMGIFSESALVDFGKLKSGELNSVDGVAVKKIVIAEPPAPGLNAPPPNPGDKSPPSPPESERLTLTTAQKGWRPMLLWQPIMSIIDVPGTGDSRAIFQGATPAAFGFEWPHFDSKTNVWLIDTTIRDFNFKPQSRDRLPFQQAVHWLEFQAHVIRFSSAVGYGFSVHQSLSVIRTNYEAIRTDTTLWFGPVMEKNFAWTSGELNLRLNALFSRDGQALMVTPEWRTRVGSRFVTGVGLETTGRLQVPDFGWLVHGYVTVGYPF